MNKNQYKYVVYSITRDAIGIHLGPKFIDLSDTDQDVHYWPHDIDHGSWSALLSDEYFRENYIYIGELY